MKAAYRYIKCSCGYITKYFAVTFEVKGTCARCGKPFLEGKYVTQREYLAQHTHSRKPVDIERERIGVILNKIRRKKSTQTRLEDGEGVDDD